MIKGLKYIVALELATTFHHKMIILCRVAYKNEENVDRLSLEKKVQDIFCCQFCLGPLSTCDAESSWSIIALICFSASLDFVLLKLSPDGLQIYRQGGRTFDDSGENIFFQIINKWF